MTRHLLPFPLRNAKDLERALDYATRVHPTDRDRVQRHIAKRAKELGRLDMIPADWTPVKQATATMTSGLDRQFEEKALEYGISSTKLKTVYFRGVQEFFDSSYDMGTPTTWGLARVQKFINAVTAGTTPADDSDLLEVSEFTTAQCGADICVDAMKVASAIMYSDASDIAEMFKPGRVSGVQLDGDVVTVVGYLEDQMWRYSLNTVTGEHNLYME